MALKPRQKKRARPTFCDKCGRIAFDDAPEFKWWLVGNGVIRCPQHITTWTLRKSGRGRSMEAHRWARQARDQDVYDPAWMSIEPLFLEEDI